MRNVDAVLFDKTGTLTTGRPAVAGVMGTDGFDEAEVLRIAGAVEADSEHPVARAIVAAATCSRAGAGGVGLPIDDRPRCRGDRRGRHLRDGWPGAAA